MRRLIAVLCLSVCASVLLAGQMHDHGAAPAAAELGQFNPFVVADAHAGFYIGYIERAGNGSNVMLRHSLDGKTSSPAVRVNDVFGDAAVRNENPPKIAVGTHGEVYVAWANERERWKGNIRFARSLDGGKTFSRALTLNSDEGGPPTGRAFESIAVAPTGAIYVAWIDERHKSERGAEIWMTVSRDNGKTFQPDRKILSDVCECCRTTLLVDGKGRLYISYRVVPRVGPMLRDIGVAHSDDGGATFTTAVVSHDQWDVNACPIAGPTMTLDQSGRLTVVWFTADHDQPRLFFSTSSDRGGSFAPRQLVTKDQTLAKHAHIVALPDGHVLIGWDDVSGISVIKWAVLDPGTRVVLPMGSRTGASYPVLAASGSRAAIVALQPDGRFLQFTIPL